MLEWVAMSSSRGSSQLRDWTQSPAWQANSLKSEPPGKPCYISSTQNIVQGRRMEAQALNTFISWDLTKMTFQQRSEEGERKLRQIFRGREFMERTATQQQPNSPWVRNMCDECGKQSKVLIRRAEWAREWNQRDGREARLFRAPGTSLWTDVTWYYRDRMCWR